MSGEKIKMVAFNRDGSIRNQWVHDTEDLPTTGVPLFARTIQQMLSEVASADALCL